MHSTIEILDAIKARHGNATDYKLAKLLGVSRQQVSNYYNPARHDSLSEEGAIVAANLLGVDAALLIAAIHAEKAKSEGARNVWKDIVERLGGVAACVLIAAGLGAEPSPAHASQPEAGPHVYYVKSNKGERSPVIPPARRRS